MADLSHSSTKNISYGCFSCAHNDSSNSRRRQAAPGSGVQSSAKHLIIMVSGIVGSVNDWKFAADKFRSKFGSEVLVHCSTRNASTLTFDGVDVMGHRLAEEVKAVVEESSNLTKISFVAHSLGGLIARYAIGQLFIAPKRMSNSNGGERANPQKWEVTEPFSNVGGLEIAEPEPSNGTIVHLKPVNFITVATPHISSRGHWQLPFLCGITPLEELAVFIAHWFVGRTGKHLFLADGDRSQPPLLRRMVSDCPEGLFISGLKAFQRRVVYANMRFDHMVGWKTSSIRRDWETSKLKTPPLDSKYPHVIHVEDLPIESNEPSSLRKPTSNPIEEEMISGLRQVSWQRVDVSFSGTAQLLTAHNTIQVKSFPKHSSGSDVISHIVDNFVL